MKFSNTRYEKKMAFLKVNFKACKYMELLDVHGR